MARAMRKSDKIYNLRRKLKRTAKQYSKMASGEMNLEKKKEYQRTAANLRSRASRLYTKGRSKAQLEKNIKSAEEYLKPRSAAGRSNKMFLDEINISKGQWRSPNKGISRNEINVFFAVTHDAWEGYRRKDRFDLIMSAVNKKYGKNFIRYESVFRFIQNTKEYEKSLGSSVIDPDDVKKVDTDDPDSVFNTAKHEAEPRYEIAYRIKLH